MSHPLHLTLATYEGPLDLLLDLARKRKLDLAPLPLLDLIEQYLAAVRAGARLELAADWLVMAAWLTWLKSRLLAPGGDAEAEEAGEALAGLLDDLRAARAAAAWLEARPKLGEAVFARGAAEDFRELDRSGWVLSVPALVRAYLAARRRGAGKMRYRPTPVSAWTMGEALARLEAMLGMRAGWWGLEALLPEVVAAEPQRRRLGLAGALLAGLEMAKAGRVTLRQDAPMGPILIRGVAAV